MRYILLMALMLLLLPQAAQAEALKVVASFSILGDMAHEIAGNAIALKTLVGPDSDTHAYVPSPADAKTLADADLVIINGLGFEGWLERLIASSGYHGPVVMASQGVPLLNDKHLAIDPHVWQSLPNAKIYVANIRDALVKADATHATLYRANAAHYLKAIDALDRWVRQEIGRVPEERRKVIISHDAFQYFGHTYGITLIPARGISSDSEPSAADIARLIDLMREHQVQALFLENITDPRLIRQLERDGGAAIGGTLYSDALSGPTGPAATYLAMFRYNVETLTQAMQRN